MSFHKTYSARSVNVIFGGIDISSGKNDGEYVSISWNEDRVNIREGMDGNASISVTPNHSATVTYTLFPESQSAKKLIALDFTLREIERNGGNYAGVVPLTISDKSGTILLFAPSAVLTKSGDVGLGEDTGTQEFTFYVHNARISAGGLELDVREEVNKSIEAVKDLVSSVKDSVKLT